MARLGRGIPHRPLITSAVQSVASSDGLFFRSKTGAINLASPVNWANPLNRGLVSWWMAVPQGPYFGGSRLLDLCGKNHGVLTNGPTWTGPLGRPGGFGSLGFDGINDWVDATYTLANSITAMCWIRTTRLVNYQLILDSTVGGMSTNTIRMYLNGAGDFTADCNGSFPQSIGTIAPGPWYHVALTRTGSLNTVYVNGIAGGTTTATAISGTPTGIRIGEQAASGTPLAGNIDDVCIFNRALSASEIYNLYQDSLQERQTTLNYIRRPILFGTGGGSTAITADNIINIEYTVTINRDSEINNEYLLIISKDSTVENENTLSVGNIDSIVSIENLLGINLDSSMQTENLLNASSDRIINVENLLETGNIDSVISTENLLGISLDSSIPTENQLSVSADSSINVEYNLSISNDNSINLEYLLNLISDNSTNNEYLLTINSDNSINVEWSGEAGITLDMIVNVEYMTNVSGDSALSTENLLALSNDLSVPTEFLATISKDGVVSIENRTDLVIDNQVALEFLTNVGSVDFTTVVEHLASLQLDSQFNVEYLTGISAALGINVENSLYLSSDNTINVEHILSSGVADLTISLEQLLAIQGSLAIHWENYVQSVDLFPLLKWTLSNRKKVYIYNEDRRKVWTFATR